ncbi:MAG: hypothetical protein ACXABF_16045 [Candidatus Thorarchaeota archaeon]|jgi:hypothetical protein
MTNYGVNYHAFREQAGSKAFEPYVKIHWHFSYKPRVNKPTGGTLDVAKPPELIYNSQVDGKRRWETLAMITNG